MCVCVCVSVCVCVCVVCVCVCVCVWCVLYGPVKPELGVIPSGQKKKKKKIQQWTFKFSCKELNVTDITEQ